MAIKIINSKGARHIAEVLGTSMGEQRKSVEKDKRSKKKIVIVANQNPHMQTNRLFLKDGREVCIKTFSVEGTYSGHLEGTKLSISNYILSALQNKGLNGSSPVTVIAEKDQILPAWKCSVYLISDKNVKQGRQDWEYRSELILHWFLDDMPNEIDKAVAAALSVVDWDEQAKGFSIDDF